MTLLKVKEITTMIINTCKEHSDKVKENLKCYFSENPTSLAILTNKTHEGEKYIKNKIKVAHEIGVRVVVYDFTELSLGNLIKELKDLDEDGIMVQMPFSQDPYVNKLIMQNIPPEKDVDGLNWRTKHLYGVYPATARGIFECFFKNTQKVVTVLGRSKLVGEPLADLLMHSKNTVVVCHSKTLPEQSHALLWESDAIVSATGKEAFSWFNRDFLESSCIDLIVDVGIRVGDDGKITGDIDKDLYDVEDINITPVPGGVGLLTTTYLYYNLMCLKIKQLYA